MRNINAIFLKQIKETLKNKMILIQLVMFPMMVIVMENAIKLDDMPEHFFVKLFSVMYVSMAPLTCMSSIIAEEKEKNTLHALMMSNVKPLNILPVHCFMCGLCAWQERLFLRLAAGTAGQIFFAFMLIMAAGILLSGLTGAVIGIFSKNQMTATSVTVPVMLIFSFLPMLSTFNEALQMSQGSPIRSK